MTLLNKTAYDILYRGNAYIILIFTLTQHGQGYRGPSTFRLQ
jgi:hypothetical protein